MPDVATEANRNVVTPPRTGLGMARKTPDIFPSTPNRIRKAQHQRPAERLAHLVIAITPLFCVRDESSLTI